MEPKMTLAERIVSFALDYDQNSDHRDNFDDVAWWELKRNMFSAIALARALKEAKRVRVWDNESGAFIFAAIEVNEWWRKYDKDDSNRAECDVFFIDVQITRFNGEWLKDFAHEINLACKNEP